MVLELILNDFLKHATRPDAVGGQAEAEAEAAEAEAEAGEGKSCEEGGTGGRTMGAPKKDAPLSPMHTYNLFETLLTERVAGLGAGAPGAGAGAGAAESKLSEEMEALAKERLNDTEHVEAVTQETLRELSEYAQAWELPQAAGTGFRGVADSAPTPKRPHR